MTDDIKPSPEMQKALDDAKADMAARTAREKQREAELSDIEESGRARLRGKFMALWQDSRLPDNDRLLIRNLGNLSDRGLDALSLTIRG